MIGYLEGKLIQNIQNPIIVLTAGVGYAVTVPEHLLTKLTNNSQTSLHIYSHIREDSFSLYGFASLEEKKYFELLINISGIGPKIAILVIDRGVEEITSAISKADVEFFTSIPKLGKKNAQKIIIELKSKIGSLQELDLTESSTSETSDVISALTSMGFKQVEVKKVLSKLTKQEKTIEQKIKKALQLLAKPN